MGRRGLGRRLPGGGSTEDAHPARPDEQADDDEDDSPEQLTPEDRDDAGDHEDDGEDPQQCEHLLHSHLREAPGWRRALLLMIIFAVLETDCSGWFEYRNRRDPVK